MGQHTERRLPKMATWRLGGERIMLTYADIYLRATTQSYIEQNEQTSSLNLRKKETIPYIQTTTCAMKWCDWKLKHNQRHVLTEFGACWSSTMTISSASSSSWNLYNTDTVVAPDITRYSTKDIQELTTERHRQNDTERPHMVTLC